MNPTHTPSPTPQNLPVINRVDTLTQLFVDSVLSSAREESPESIPATVMNWLRATVRNISHESLMRREPGKMQAIAQSLQEGPSSEKFRAAVRDFFAAILNSATPLAPDASALSQLSSPPPPRENQPTTQRLDTQTLPPPNKGGLVSEVALRLGIVDMRTANAVTDAVLDAIQHLVTTCGKISLKGFGVFVAKDRKGRSYTHPLTGESIEVPTVRKVTFSPSEIFNEKVRGSDAKARPDQDTPA